MSWGGFVADRSEFIQPLRGFGGQFRNHQLPRYVLWDHGEQRRGRGSGRQGP